jgi:hypothetical protein
VRQHELNCAGDLNVDSDISIELYGMKKSNRPAVLGGNWQPSLSINDVGFPVFAVNLANQRSCNTFWRLAHFYFPQ